MPYRMNIQEVVQETYSDLDKGLSEQEAAARLRDQGKNELLKKKKETVFQMFLEQFQDPMVIILIIGAIVSIFLKEYIDASIILTVIILNAIIGVVQEFKAEKAIDALEKLSTPKAFVVREGFLKEIDSKELVVGDLVELEVGGYIPADMRLVSSVNLKVKRWKRMRPLYMMRKSISPIRETWSLCPPMLHMERPEALLYAPA